MSRSTKHPTEPRNRAKIGAERAREAAHGRAVERLKDTRRSPEKLLIIKDTSELFPINSKTAPKTATGATIQSGARLKPSRARALDYLLLCAIIACGRVGVHLISRARRVAVRAHNARVRWGGGYLLPIFFAVKSSVIIIYFSLVTTFRPSTISYSKTSPL